MKKGNFFTSKLFIYTLLISSVFILGCWGFYDYNGILSKPNSFWGLLYSTIKLFSFKHEFEEDKIPLLLNILRFLAPTLIATALVDIFFKYLKLYINLTMIRFFYKNQIIICGLSLKAKMLINFFKKDLSKIVVIEINPDNSYLNDVVGQKLKVIYGDASDKDTLIQAGVLKASKVFITTGSDITNLKITGKIQAVFEQNSKDLKKHRLNQLKVILVITENAYVKVFKNFQNDKSEMLDIHSFNIYQKAAGYLIDKYSPDQYVPLTKPEDQAAHILVHGLNKVGENIIIEAGQMYHFANLKKPRITVVDWDIIPKRALFLKNHPTIEDVIDITFHEERDYIGIDFAKSSKGISVCFICENNEAESIIKARQYRQLFFNRNVLVNKKNISHSTNNQILLADPLIVANLSESADLLPLFENINSTVDFLQICLENMYDNVCSKKLLSDGHEAIDDIAKQFHNIYLNLGTKELDIQWENLTDEGKDANRYPAHHVAIKLRFLGAEIVTLPNDKPDFDFDNITEVQKEIIAKMEHNRWNAEKLLSGFVAGEDIFDMDFYVQLKSKLKWHKDIRPWSELSSTEKVKDDMLTQLKTITSNLKHKKTIIRNATIQ